MPTTVRPLRLSRLAAVVSVSVLAAGLVAVGPAPIARASAPPPPDPADYKARAVPVNGIVLHGAGWGHQVGMSQYGAYAQAAAGRTATDILTYYYRDIELARPVEIVSSTITVWLARAATASLNVIPGNPAPIVRVGTVTGTCTNCVVHSDGTVTGASVALPRVTRDTPFFLDLRPTLVEVAEAEMIGVKGDLKILPRADGSGLNILNTMRLDDEYVYGVAEVPSSWPEAVLDAQAIAARTYAFQRNRGGSCDCDIRSDTFDQVYAGWGKTQDARWRAAVDRTKGTVIFHNGQKISALYSSSSGGATENNEDAFGSSPVAYLRSVDDPWSLHPINPYRSWVKTMSGGEAASALGFDVLYGLAITRKTQGGSIGNATASGLIGGVGTTRTFTGPQLQYDFDLLSTHASVPSSSFDEFIALYNPATETVTATVTMLLTRGDPPVNVPVSLPARSRQTLHVNDFAPFREVSVAVKATKPIVAYRSMYFVYQGKWAAGHTAEGVTQARNRWLLAEGYVSPRFDTYVLVANPGPIATVAKMRILGGDGTIMTHDLPLGPRARGTVRINDVTGNGFGDVSIEVIADQPVVAERAQYFDYGEQRITGGHDAAGVPEPATSWTLAEGYTAEAFDTYVLVANPGDTPARVTYTFLRPSGPPVVETRTVGPHSRATVVVDAVPGLEATEVSTFVTSDVPVVAERAVYFQYYGRADGHDAQGVTGPSLTWYLADGRATPKHDTYVLIANPDPAREATVKVEYHSPSGPSGTRTMTVPAQSRRTVYINNDVAGDIATVVNSVNDVPVVAELAMYYDFNGRKGGSGAIGVATPATDWFFAEGYTGS